jgi:hypothetical protein
MTRKARVLIWRLQLRDHIDLGTSRHRAFGFFQRRSALGSRLVSNPLHIPNFGCVVLSGYHVLQKGAFKRVLLGPVDADHERTPWHFRPKHVGGGEVLQAIKHIPHVHRLGDDNLFPQHRHGARPANEGEYEA